VLKKRKKRKEKEKEKEKEKKKVVDTGIAEGKKAKV